MWRKPKTKLSLLLFVCSLSLKHKNTMYGQDVWKETGSYEKPTGMEQSYIPHVPVPPSSISPWLPCLEIWVSSLKCHRNVILESRWNKGDVSQQLKTKLTHCDLSVSCFLMTNTFGAGPTGARPRSLGIQYRLSHNRMKSLSPETAEILKSWGVPPQVAAEQITSKPPLTCSVLSVCQRLVFHLKTL